MTTKKVSRNAVEEQIEEKNETVEEDNIYFSSQDDIEDQGSLHFEGDTTEKKAYTDMKFKPDFRAETDANEEGDRNHTNVSNFQSVKR